MKAKYAVYMVGKKVQSRSTCEQLPVSSDKIYVIVVVVMQKRTGQRNVAKIGERYGPTMSWLNYKKLSEWEVDPRARCSVHNPFQPLMS